MRVRPAGLLPLLSGILVSCQPPDGNKEEILVFAAASLHDTVAVFADAFAEETGTRVKVNHGSSGGLARQILAAPRADLFLSAHPRWMDEIEEAGRLRPGTRIPFLRNQLAVVSHPDSPWKADDPALLAQLDFRHLAIGDPAHVPAGTYAEEWMRSIALDGGETLWDRVKDQTIPTTTVRSALAQVRARRDTIGIVYRSDALAFPEDVHVVCLVPMAEGPDIVYPAAILADAPNPEGAQQFLDYLQSSRAAVTWHEAGFFFAP